MLQLKRKKISQDIMPQMVPQTLRDLGITIVPNLARVLELVTIFGPPSEPPENERIDALIKNPSSQNLSKIYGDGESEKKKTELLLIAAHILFGLDSIDEPTQPTEIVESNKVIAYFRKASLITALSKCQFHCWH
jgi:hypothetical protein